MQFPATIECFDGSPIAMMIEVLSLKHMSVEKPPEFVIMAARKPKNAIKENLLAYAFLSPWIIGFVLFSGIPIIASFALSFTSWNFIESPEFVGLKNYIEMFSANSTFWNTIWATFIFTVFGVLVSLVWALFLAVLLNLKLKANSIFQFLFFIPAVMPSVAMAFVFQLMFNQEIGIINYLLSFIGINGPNWLVDQFWVMPTIIFTCIYTYSTGQMMLIFSASLKEVPRELYEACELDGGNGFHKFFYVTLPSISPIILFNLVMATINSLNGSFALIYPLTGGGPNEVTNVISLDIFHNAFQTFRMGYASALSVILFVLVAVISGLQFIMSKRWVHYES